MLENRARGILTLALLFSRGGALETSILEQRPALMERFQLIKVLGEGAAGAVYHVHDRLSNKEVALKVLMNKSAFDEHTLQRFKQEIEACQSIRHPNIVEAYDFIELPDTIAFSMEFVDGKDLRYSFAEGKLDYQEIDDIFDQLLSALSELHQRGIIHRDIKLENVLIRKDGLVKLSDLGLMKRLDKEKLTRTGVLLGTAQYLPPEYIKGSLYDHRGDIYVAGIMLYELLTGKRRLADKAGVEAIEHLIKTKFKVPKINLTGVPKKYLYIIEKSLDPNPKKRFQSAEEMQDAFLRSFNGLEEDSLALESRVPFSAFSSRSASHLADFCRPFLKGGSFIKVFILALVVIVSAGGAFFLYTQKPILAGGKYKGTLSAADGTLPIQLRVDQRGIFVKTGIKKCSSGYISRFSNEILCDTAGMKFQLESVRGTDAYGSIVDSETEAHYKFKIALEG